MVFYKVALGLKQLQNPYFCEDLIYINLKSMGEELVLEHRKSLALKDQSEVYGHFTQV